MKRKPIFDAVGSMVPGIWNKPGTVEKMDELLDLAGVDDAPDLPAAGAALPVADIKISPRMAAEIVGHEAIVQEAYKDSVGVWTWGIGVTDASGHGVLRYKDAPTPIEKVLEIYVWLLETKYAPGVRAAFAGCKLTEAEFTAALSFHYNTGAISKAGWVKLWKAGEIAQAKTAFMEWRKPPEIIERREKERDLFFDGKWSGDGKTTVWQVRKPSYSIDWKSGKRIDVLTPLTALLS